MRPRSEPGRYWLLGRRSLTDGGLAQYLCFWPPTAWLADLVVGVAGRRWVSEESFEPPSLRDRLVLQCGLVLELRDGVSLMPGEEERLVAYLPVLIQREKDRQAAQRPLERVIERQAWVALPRAT